MKKMKMMKGMRLNYDSQLRFASLCIALHRFASLCIALHRFASLCIALHRFACVTRRR
jgi:hypothetical protein